MQVYDELSLFEQLSEMLQDQLLEDVSRGIVARHEKADKLSNDALYCLVSLVGKPKHELDYLFGEVKEVQFLGDFGQGLADHSLVGVTGFSEFLLLGLLFFLGNQLVFKLQSLTEIFLLSENCSHVPFIEIDQKQLVVQESSLVLRDDFLQPLLNVVLVYGVSCC